MTPTTQTQWPHPRHEILLDYGTDPIPCFNSSREMLWFFLVMVLPFWSFWTGFVDLHRNYHDLSLLQNFKDTTTDPFP